MPRQRLPVQYFADMLDQLRSMNAKLDTLIGQSAPQTAPAEPTAEPAPVRLEEPVRPTSEPDEVIDIPIAEPVNAGAMPKIDPDFPDSGRAENAPEGNCQELTKRGNTCGKPLPCRYHG